jgi:hypothetical protein
MYDGKMALMFPLDDLKKLEKTHTKASLSFQLPQICHGRIHIVLNLK